MFLVSLHYWATQTLYLTTCCLFNSRGTILLRFLSLTLFIRLFWMFLRNITKVLDAASSQTYIVNKIKARLWIMAGNTSLQLGSTASHFLVSFTSLQTIIGSLSNGFVIITFLAARELRKRPSDLFILNLAVADLIFLTTFQPWLTHVLNQKAVITFEPDIMYMNR